MMSDPDLCPHSSGRGLQGWKRSSVWFGWGRGLMPPWSRSWHPQTMSRTCLPVHSRRVVVNFVSKQIDDFILMGMENPSKWGIYHEILTRAFRDIVTMIPGQECLKTTFIDVFSDFFLCLWNNWSFSTILNQFWWLTIQISDQNGHEKNDFLQ